MILVVSLFTAHWRSTAVLAQQDMLEREQSLFYTLMPMFMPQAPGSLIYDELLKTMAVDQGYEAHCAQMQWEMDKDLWGAINKFFGEEAIENFNNGLDPTIFGFGGDRKGAGIDPYVVDFTRGRIPMMRGLESRRDIMKNTSLEGMFGANYLTASDYLLNSSGVAPNLLSSYQQCLAKAQNIVAAAYICDEIINEECTIDKEASFHIAINQNDGTSRRLASANEPLREGEVREKVAYYMKNLRGWFAEIRPNLHGKELYEQVCYDITGGDSYSNNPNYEPPPVDNIKLAKLREAIAVLPIDLDSLYRLAFLVLSPQQNKGKEDDNDKFYWLQSPAPQQQIDSEAHAPIFIAFKIPDFGTNKSRIANNIDSLELTKMAIQTKAQNDKDLLDQNKKREAIHESAKAARLMTGEEKVLNCPTFYNQCKRTDENALNNVLEDMINGAKIRCLNDNLRIIRPQEGDGGIIDTSEINLTLSEKQEVMTAVEYIFNQEDLNWERAGDLFTPANKDIKTNEYRGPVNTHIADWLKSKKENPYEWQLVIDNNPPEMDAPIKINAYMILPIGETIKDVNKALTVFWDEEAFFDMVEKNVIADMIEDEQSGAGKMGAIPKYMTLQGAEFGFNAIDYINPLDECVVEFYEDENGVLQRKRICKRYQFGVSFSETKGEMLIPDFGLGFMVRKIQQVIRATFDKTYDYISSCQRVEDMFLGRCSGDPDGIPSSSFCDGVAFGKIKNMPSAATIPHQARDAFTASIATKITPEHIEAYKYAEEQTGIPCEVVAGIHWTEGGSNINQSVWDGGAIRGGSFKEDAASAMKHLIGMWPGSFNKDNITYESLTAAISAYNGPGNMNCSVTDEGRRPTRWRNNGKCEAQFEGEDHPHAVAFIDQRHADMDLIYCIDRVEWQCNTNGTGPAINNIVQHLKNLGWSDPAAQAHAEAAKNYCFADSTGSNVCQALSDGRKYPRYERPGSITTAILFYDAGSAR